MSIIASLITNNFAIVMGDTKAKHNGNIFESQKVKHLVDGPKEILIGFVGALSYNHISVQYRLDSLSDHLFRMYGDTPEIIRYLHTYFDSGIRGGRDINGNESIALNIISKSDHEKGVPLINTLFIDYRKGEIHSYPGVKSLNHQCWQFGREGDGPARVAIEDYFRDNGHLIRPDDLTDCMAHLEAALDKAIEVCPDTCGKPINTIKFTLQK